MDPSTLALRTAGLTLSFGWNRVIRGLDLEVPRGTIYGFLGRNGAGKTSTIRMLMGILAPDGGWLSLGGDPVRRTTPRMRARVGYVSQQQHFYPWMRVRRLAAFVAPFYPTWDPARFDALCRELVLDPRQRVGELSGGTRMKLALALAIAHRPPLLILDEPTAGVDPVTRREILDLLRAMVDREGVTVFFSTHQIAEVEEIGHQVGILHDGRLFWQGPVGGVAERVRRVPGRPPEGATALQVDPRGTVIWGPPEVVRSAPGAEPLSLEAAFLAIARTDRIHWSPGGPAGGASPRKDPAPVDPA
jgi:ABC-2 type transport system ATP-binding protein